MKTSRDAVVYLAGVDWEAVKGTDRQLVEQLARHRSVLWVDPPLSVARLLRVGGERARLRSPIRVTSVADGITAVSVVGPPFPERPGFDRIADVWMRWALGIVRRRLGVSLRGVISSGPFRSMNGLASGPAVYYATDDFVAGSELLGLSRASLERAESRRLAEADVCAAVSPAILERWGRGADGVVLPNGCDPSAFAPTPREVRPPDVSLRAPIAGLVGQISTRIDLTLLEAVADEGVSLLLVGPVVEPVDRGRFDRLVARENVEWVGPKKFEELAGYLGLMDVGLTPYADTAFNRASFPLKTLEYLSAGLPVVSTPLPAVAALATDLVRASADRAEFAKLTRDAARTHEPGEAERRRAFAETHSWSERAATLVELLG